MNTRALMFATTALLVALSTGRLVAQDAVKGPPSPAEEMLTSARMAYRTYWNEAQGERGTTDSEGLRTFSIRILEAQQQLVSDGNTKQRAAKEHLERMNELQAWLAARNRAGASNSADIVAARFYVAEAEHLLDRSKNQCAAAERERVQELQTTRVYQVKDLVLEEGTNQADYDSLIELITTTTRPESWDDVGGPGAIAPWEKTHCLVVSQRAEIHDEIAALLKDLRASGEDAE